MYLHQHIICIIYIFALSQSQNPSWPGRKSFPSGHASSSHGWVFVAGATGATRSHQQPPAATSSFKVLLCDAVHIALPAWEGVADFGKVRCFRWYGGTQVLQDIPP